MLGRHYPSSSLLSPPPTPHSSFPRNFGFRPYIFGYRHERWRARWGLKRYPSALSLRAAVFAPGAPIASFPQLIHYRCQPSPDDFKLGGSSPSSRSYDCWVYADGGRSTFTFVAARRLVSVPWLRTTPPFSGAFENVCRFASTWLVTQPRWNPNYSGELRYSRGGLLSSHKNRGFRLAQSSAYLA